MTVDISQPVQAWARVDAIHEGSEPPEDGQEWRPIRYHEDFEQTVAALEDPELVAEEEERERLCSGKQE